jgi:hypothetical protein
MQQAAILFISAVLAFSARAAHINEEKPGGTPDGVLQTFTLAKAAIPSSLSVHANGLLNYQGLDYDVVQGAIVFRPASIPQNGWDLRVSYDTPFIIAIDAGGPGDQYFVGPDKCAAGGACAFTDSTMGPGPFATIRYGYGMIPLVYRIPAPIGSCDLALQFSEPNKTAAGQRVFTVVANDQTLVDVDILARAGAAKTPTTINLTVQVANGLLQISFTPKPGTWNAFVSGITGTCQPAS